MKDIKIPHQKATKNKTKHCLKILSIRVPAPPNSAKRPKYIKQNREVSPIYNLLPEISFPGSPGLVYLQARLRSFTSRCATNADSAGLDSDEASS
jgi:hypothetical protein